LIIQLVEAAGVGIPRHCNYGYQLPLFSGWSQNWLNVSSFRVPRINLREFKILG